MELEQSFEFPVKIDWENHTGTIWWNETCAMVLETFGLPGNKYVYKPHVDHMIFHFKSEKDALLCKILLSDRL